MIKKTDSPRIYEDSAENLFNQPASLKVPLLWLGLILAPILLGLIGTVLTSGDEEAFAPPRPRPTLQTSVPQAPSEVPVRGGQSTRREQLNAPVVDVCPFKTYVGKTVDQSVINAFRALERPVIFEKESGQRAPTADKKRINIYVDPYRVITRIVCG